VIPNRNVLWGRAVAQEVSRGGVQHVCIAPGSRSTPLVLALHEQPGLRLSTHLDERGAAFFALGVAKATQRPVALVATSGTAVANFLPAVIEASHARVPLLVLTADRPPELHDVGANQSIDQRALFGPHPRFVADAGAPEPTPSRVRHVRALVGRALAFARGPPAGPVHLNFPFREPLEPSPVPGDVPTDWAKGDAEAEHGRAHGHPFVAVAATVRVPDAAALAALQEAVARRPRGLIVAGPRDAQDDLAAAIAELSRRTGFPVLADALSGLRFGAPDGAPVLSGHDAFLTHAATRDSLRPDVILRFGAAPTSKALLTFLRERREAHHVVIDESGRLGEETSHAHLTLAADPVATVRALLDALPADVRRDESWTARWQRLESTTWRVLEPELALRGFEGAALARLAVILPAHATLFVSNSLPVRDLERFARGGAKSLRVLANRGASGIDGIVSTALGVAHGLGRRATLAIGDLAFLHDVNGFVAARRLGIALDVLLVNNDGGGIFEFLPVSAQEPPFTELFVTPHGLDVAPLAQAFGLAHRRIPVAEAPRLAFDATERGALLEVTSDRKDNVRHRRELEALVAHALEREAVVAAD
jgi:2-succinyl-5-enolpyruvyl-6-hydroxy-3-cyclohexene-1-carboxylate synthase